MKYWQWYKRLKQSLDNLDFIENSPFLQSMKSVLIQMKKKKLLSTAIWQKICKKMKLITATIWNRKRKAVPSWSQSIVLLLPVLKHFHYQVLLTLLHTLFVFLNYFSDSLLNFKLLMQHSKLNGWLAKKSVGKFPIVSMAKFPFLFYNIHIKIFEITRKNSKKLTVCIVHYVIFLHSLRLLKKM